MLRGTVFSNLLFTVLKWQKSNKGMILLVCLNTSDVCPKGSSDVFVKNGNFGHNIANNTLKSEDSKENIISIIPEIMKTSKVVLCYFLGCHFGLYIERDLAISRVIVHYIGINFAHLGS